MGTALTPTLANWELTNDRATRQGLGIAWRSTWEVENDIRSGQLVEVLAEFAAPPNGIYGVFPQRKHLPLRLRLWIDFLKHHYSLPSTWQSAP